MLAVIVVALALLLLPTATASARERVLTLYSPKISTLPYVHDTHNVVLRPNGREAPAEPGFITGFKEMSLVDSKNPRAKPLPNSKMMVHHFLYFAPGRVDQAPASCWGQSGFISGRGEEHPSGTPFRVQPPPSVRRHYGINNRLANGTAPTWILTAMVMNHYRRPKSFFIRTRIWYTDERRRSIMPTVVGDCSQLSNGMAYDVPGGGGRGSRFVDRSSFTVPPGMGGRIVLAASHQHGGAIRQTLRSRTCGRRIFNAPAYYGTRNHIYNRIRPILHEPGPIGNGAYASLRGIPISEGEVLDRAAIHENSNLHVASMGFWVLFIVRDPSVRGCGRMPRDVVEVNRPRRFDRTPNHRLRVPQLYRPSGPFQPFGGNPLTVGDQFFQPGRVSARVGETLTWRFSGSQPHSVTVANGPRGFSSVYNGQRSGSYSFTPRVRGTYRLTCLVHPTKMGQTLEVQ
jgi:hypothetical protein